MSIPQLILAALTAYLTMGALFAIPFVIAGVGRIDPVARHTPVSFRFVILPGSAALWPWLLWRWIRTAGSRPRSPS